MLTLQNTRKIEKMEEKLERQNRMERADTRRHTVLASHLIAIAMGLTVLGVVFSVVWQSAVARSMELNRIRLEKEISVIDQEQRFWRAAIAQQETPARITASSGWTPVDPSSLHYAGVAD